ncbi:hypothetical protein CYMTET_25432, partial [Cymbomonas tetramitiformis]
MRSKNTSAEGASDFDMSFVVPHDAAPELFEARILCISNGHGEDTIAVAILKELEKEARDNGVSLQVTALPLVGMGGAYAENDITLLAPRKKMPSGGFINTDRSQLLRDLRAGLLPLLRQQWEAVIDWTQEADSMPNSKHAVLAVGDVVPLAFAAAASSKSLAP